MSQRGPNHDASASWCQILQDLVWPDLLRGYAELAGTSYNLCHTNTADADTAVGALTKTCGTLGPDPPAAGSVTVS